MNTKLMMVMSVFMMPLLAHGQQWQLAVARPNVPAKIVVPGNAYVEFGAIRGGNLTNNSTTLDYGNGAVSTVTSGVVDYPLRYVGPVTITQTASGGASAFSSIGYRIQTPATLGTAAPLQLVVARPNVPAKIVVPANAIIEFVTVRGSGTNITNNTTTLDFGNGAITTATSGLVDTTTRYVGPVTITQTVTGAAASFIAIGYRITN